jgi:glycosyltransferase involved in cell wall biosynthesis
MRGRYLAPIIAVESAISVVARLPGVIGSHAADVTWLERNFVPLFDDLACVLRRPLAFDIDDAIWLYNPGGRAMIGRLVSRAAVAIAGNSFIADWCSTYCENVRIVPTAIDTSVYQPRQPLSCRGEEFVIGWIGTASNFVFLESIQSALSEFLAITPTASFVVVAERPPNLNAIPRNRVRFVRWKEELEQELLQRMDVGLMPLIDSDLARGKCSFKMLQYMACGVPVVVSPVGMNAELLALGNIGFGARSKGEWVDALRACYLSPQAARDQGLAGRRIVESSYSTSVVAARLASALRSAR